MEGARPPFPSSPLLREGGPSMTVGVAAVVGGSGFVGRYVVQALCRAGARVRVAVRRPDAASFLKPMGDVGQVAAVQANLRDDASVARAVAGADAVVNLAGVLFERGRQSFQAVHVEGAGRLARAAAAAGAARFVHVSALGADPDSPAAYARSKAAGEAAVRAAFPQADVVRPSVVFGCEDDFFNRFARMARIAPALPSIGGAGRLQPVYAADVAAGIAAILEDGRGCGRLYEFGGPGVYGFAEILGLVLEWTGRRRPLLPVPARAALAAAFFLERLPAAPPLTRDQVRMLAAGAVVSGAPGLAELGIAPTGIESVVPAYLARHRKGGGRGQR